MLQTLNFRYLTLEKLIMLVSQNLWLCIINNWMLFPNILAEWNPSTIGLSVEFFYCFYYIIQITNSKPSLHNLLLPQHKLFIIIWFYAPTNTQLNYRENWYFCSLEILWQNLFEHWMIILPWKLMKFHVLCYEWN